MQVELPSQAGAHEKTISLSEQLSAGIYEVMFCSGGQMLNILKLVKY